MGNIDETVISHLLSQIDKAKSELEALEANLEVPVQRINLFESSSWNSFFDRCKSTAVSLTKALETHKIDLLNAEGLFFNRVITQVNASFKEEVKAYIQKNVNSIAVSSFLCEKLSEISPAFSNQSQSNDYPDLIRTDFDYTFLPTSSIEPGSMGRRGSRPINIPDGVEIKTSKNHSITLDCHGPKIDTFAYCPWHVVEGEIRLQDIYLAFLKKSDFKRGKTSSAQTTPKWNIKDTSAFISLVTGKQYRAKSRLLANSVESSLFEFKGPEVGLLHL